MASPFPGMDPYLEQSWGDVHHRLITYAADQLQSSLPRDLRARVEERVFVESGQSVQRTVYPDIRIVERKSRKRRRPAGAGLAVAEPLVIRLGDEPMSQGFIEIIDVASGRRVVTVVEILSPANKYAGAGQELYLRKQAELLDGRVSLVEVDLLRGGDWVLAVPRQVIPLHYRTPYRVVVRRGWEPDHVEVYRLPLQEKLPAIKVPLRETDADVPLDLQAIIDQCYRNGDYDDIDYTVEPDPPLPPKEARWVDGLLRLKGRRPEKKKKNKR